MRKGSLLNRFTLPVPLLGLLFWVGCSKPQAGVESPRKLEIPGFGSLSGGFSLFESSMSRSFYGQLLIWDPGVRSEQVAKTLRLKREANERMIDRLRAWDAFYDGTLGPARIELERQVRDGEVAQRASASRVRADSLPLASGWFAGRLSELEAVATPQTVRFADDLFGAFCEAKIFSFAASGALAQMTFRERPTPSALCEGYYASAGLFASDECAPAAEGKNYFSCLWREGLLRSKFASRYSPEQRQVLTDLAGNADFRRIFSGAIDPGCALFKVRGQNRIRVEATAEILASHLMNGLKNQEFTCNGVSASFSLGDSASSGPAFEKQTPAKIVDDLETRSADCATTLCLVPPQMVDGSAVSQEAQRWGKEISRQLLAFGRQSLACGTERASWWTKNFLLFNAPVALSDLQGSVCNEPAAQEMPAVVARDEQLDEARARVAAAQQIFDREKQRACLSFDDSCDRESPLNQLADRERDATEDASEAALEAGIALTFIPGFSVATSRDVNGNDSVRVSFDSFGRQRAWWGCMAVAPRVCMQTVSSSGDLPLQSVSMDAASQALRFEIALDEVSVFAKKSGDVEPVVARDFPGSVLRMELYPALMGDFLPYLAGKVTILKGGREIFQGVGYGVDSAFNDKHRRIYFGGNR